MSRQTENRFVVLVCGGRNFNDHLLVFRILDEINILEPITLIVQGYARGADRLADEWARKRGVPSTGKQYEVTSEMWRQQGRAAGHIRNHKMRVEQKPDLVLAFPGGPGTEGMCNIADRAGVPVIRVTTKGKII